MGDNFFTPWQDDVTEFKQAHMNLPLYSLDQALTHLKNVIVSCDGLLTYNKATGVLTWSDVIRIHFNNDDGNATLNTIAAGNLTLADNEFAYVDLNDTNNTALTAAKAAISTGSASNFLAQNRLVLGYRNAVSDNFYGVYLRNVLQDPGKIVQTLTSADNVTVDWSRGSTAEILLDRATTTFAFMGAFDGQRCVLVCKQDGTGGRAVAFGSEVRAGTDLSSPPTLSAADLTDYLGYIYRDADSKYDFVWLIKGF